MATPAVKPDLNLSHHSFSSFNSQEQLEAVLTELMRGRGGTRGWCNGEPVTDSGKRRQIVKMLLLTLLPVAVLLCVNVYYIDDIIHELKNTYTTKSVMSQSTQLGRLIHVLQRERDQSVLYISSIGPETKTYLLKRYLETDDVMDSLLFWPNSLRATTIEFLQSKKAFKRYLVQHRNEIDLLGWSIFDEIDFYNKPLKVLQGWLYVALTETRYSILWKTVVAYQKVVLSKEYLGVERALGVYAHANGGFTEMENYIYYNKQVNIFRHVFRSAQNYSPLVHPISYYEEAQSINLTILIYMYREQIQNRNITSSSVSKASLWFDNMTIYMDILYSIQTDLSNKIRVQLAARERSIITRVIIISLLMLAVIMSAPVLIRTIYRLTSNIQSYAITLADKTRELNREKKRTDSLLYQMLPKSVAEQLKRQKDVNAEYFKEVTIFFSDISGFTKIVVDLQPMQVIRFLNELFRLFDERIDLYDVYKVETIADSYMVASGVPRRNHNQHAPEIANMALDLLATCSDLVLTDVTNDRVRLRIGMHSANRIHLSQDTQRILEKNGGHSTQRRGIVNLKGKGQMTTFWLLGHEEEAKGSHIVRPFSGKGFSPDHGDQATGDAADFEFMRPKVRASSKHPKASTSVDIASSKDTQHEETSLVNLDEDMPHLPSYEEIEKEFEAKKSPPIIQLTEGYHF